MKYTVRRKQENQPSDIWYVQHSKKLSGWALLQWVVITLVVIAALFFADWTAAETEVLGGIVTWSATLAAVVVTGYMGNSSIEKYADRKFAIEQTIDGKG